MKKLVLLLLAALLSAPQLRADKGMWLPSLIGSRIKDMKAKGFRLTAEDIYSVNEASLKDAVVLFNGGCTGELISDEGLLLTNHHCGYSAIQSHSSVEHDYLTHGFWAMNRQEELPNPKLYVSFLVRMDDVTDRVLKGVKDDLPVGKRDEKIRSNIDGVIAEATRGTRYKADVESFFYGNQYFLFVYENFTDVRLVGAPPSSVGKFGGDTDNWMWPRHTGDFSLFRIYADSENRPADYSPDNVPYRPRRSLAISTEGLKEGDFTFIYGFPGTTKQYILSDEVDYILNRSNPHKIGLRTMRLDIMSEEQAKSVATRIQYASKHAGVANAWKKWQGESKGLARLGTLENKREAERRFQQWADAHPAYADVLPQMHGLYAELAPYAFARDYYAEAYGAVELTRFASRLVRAGAGQREAMAREFYKDYSPVIDARIAKKTWGEYLRNVPQEFLPEAFAQAVAGAGGVDAAVEKLFAESRLTDSVRFAAWLSLDEASRQAALEADPATAMAAAFDGVYLERIAGPYRDLNARIAALYRIYMRGLMEMEPDAVFYPDANLTLRVSYGRMEGYKPLDGVYYTPQTTLEGIMEKDNPDIYDYDIPQRLRDLYAGKDYGRWAVDGTVPVAFLATNHTTGGNSGSPVLNGRGELVGLNFDRTWESTMSDIEFDPAKCRNIAVDIRYVLFLIDKVGGAGYLLDEMRFAR